MDEITRERRTGLAGVGSSTLEAVAGALAVVLAIVGLTGTAPAVMAAFGAILLGVALLLEGGALAAHYAAARDALAVTGEKGAVGGGVSAELIAGAAAVVLGVLSLVGVERLVMLHVAAIVLGAGLLFGGGLVANTYEVHGEAWSTARERRVAQAAAGAGNAEGMIGAGAIVLGILALIGVSVPLTLSLVAMLAVGAGVVLGGAAMARRLRMLAHRAGLGEATGRFGRLSDHELRT